MENQVQIISDPLIIMGKPVVAGTRITVELILEKLAAGETPEQILAAHPRLTPAAISAALDKTLFYLIQCYLRGFLHATTYSALDIMIGDHSH
jgi:uncharacterized protein (DUF433 family)